MARDMRGCMVYSSIKKRAQSWVSPHLRKSMYSNFVQLCVVMGSIFFIEAYLKNRYSLPDRPILIWLHLNAYPIQDVAIEASFCWLLVILLATDTLSRLTLTSESSKIFTPL